MWLDQSEKLMIKVKDSSKVIGGRISMTRKAFLKALAYDQDTQYEIKHIFNSKPTFAKYTKVNEFYRKLLKTTIPSEKHQEKLCESLE